MEKLTSKGKRQIYRKIVRKERRQLSSSSLYFKQGESVTLNLRIYRLNLEAYEGVPQLLERTRLLSDRMGVLSSYEKIKILEGERLLR
jgi:hypothetical protein